MKKLHLLLSAGLACLTVAGAAANVLTYHNSYTRAGAYRVRYLTQAAAASMHRDTGFSATITGNVYAQPLYWRLAGERHGHVIVATESNIVYSLNDITGATEWQTQLAAPMPLDQLPCGNIDPMGTTGTPVIDPATGTLYLNAQTQTVNGARHMLYAISLADGSVVPGWPLDMQAAMTAQGASFSSATQGERSALLLFKSKLYVTYGGNAGDCQPYHGTVAQVTVNPPGVDAVWQTRAARGGIWAQGGIAGDGAGLYITTGNTSGVSTWSDGEAIIRLQPGLAHSDATKDFFTPSNWHDLDGSDKDLGGTEALPLNVPNPAGRPARRLIAFGKDGNAYLIDRANMGGIGGQIAIFPTSTSPIRTAPAVYETDDASMVALSTAGNATCSGKNLTMLSIAPSGANPVSFVWCALYNGAGAPIVTTTDGSANPIVWVVGAEGDGLLHGYNVLTGAPVFSDAGPKMTGLHHFQTILATPRRFYIAADNTVYAYTYTP